MCAEENRRLKQERSLSKRCPRLKNRLSQRGSSLVDFAVVLTVLFTMVFGIMDFSRAMYADHWVSYAARAATRYASVHGSSYPTQCPTTSPFVLTSSCQISSTSSANVTNYVESIAPSIYLNGSTTGNGGLTVTTTWPGASGNPTGCNTTNGTNSPGCQVKVVISCGQSFVHPHAKHLRSDNFALIIRNQIAIRKSVTPSI
jgi:Flp pilus assembly protein TadG